MKLLKEEEAGSHGWRHTDWLHTSLDLSFQPQRSSSCALPSALASDTPHGEVSTCRTFNFVDIRECLQEISVAQVVGLLRAILSCDHDRERLPVVAEGTHGFHQFRGGIVSGTYEHSNFLARLGTSYAQGIRWVSKIKGTSK
jgi:hypothetical protein